MKYFQVAFAVEVEGLYLMIAVALMTGMTGNPWPGLLGVPLFFNCYAGNQLQC